jgi:hypothetical protein
VLEIISLGGKGEGEIFWMTFSLGGKGEGGLVLEIISLGGNGEGIIKKLLSPHHHDR